MGDRSGQAYVTRYFHDGKRRIDYVAVFPGNVISDPKKIVPITSFINTLHEAGIKMEQSYLSPNIYLKMHVPANKLVAYAKLAKMDITTGGHFVFEKKKDPTFYRTTLNVNRNDYFYRKPNEVTSAERLLMLKALLLSTEFPNGCALTQLISNKLVLAAFPIHDGDHDFKPETPDEQLNDRQLLIKYWGSLRLFYKEQPLNLIQKYYGSEVGFYFAWLGFYNQMLMPAAIFGTLMYFTSVLVMAKKGNPSLDEICNSNVSLCPICHPLARCKPTPLRDACTLSYWTYIHDNFFVAATSIFMTLWAVLFLKLWRRKESTLRVRWNLSRFDRYDTVFRPEFRQSMPWRKMKLSTAMEPYMKTRDKIWRQTVSSLILVLMILVSASLTIGIVVTMLAVKAWLAGTTKPHLKKNKRMVAMICSSLLGVAIIKTYALLVYAPVSNLLTILEKPRTQQEFDSSILYKSYFLAFVNNNLVLLYTAFLKGQLYGPQNKGFLQKIDFDICHVSGCILDLTMQLSFILTLKKLVFNVIALVSYPIKATFMQALDREFIGLERELKLKPAPRLFLIKEYLEMVIQFGLVTCYITAQPLAPLFALINNTLELRLDAKKLAVYYRRPEPNRVAGIGEWNSILFGVSMFGIVTNAFVLSFTSDFVPKALYSTNNRSDMIGYFNTTLSAFDMHDLVRLKHNIDGNSGNPICYYRGRRNEPYVEARYNLTPEHWHIMGIKFVCVIAIEYVLLLVNACTTMAITEVPHWVKEYYTEKQRTLDRQRRADAVQKEGQRARRASQGIATRVFSKIIHGL